MKRNYKKPEIKSYLVNLPKMICNSTMKWSSERADTSKEILSREVTDWDWDE